MTVKNGQKPEITNEDVLLSLADENARVLPISDNTVYFPRPEGGDGYLSKTRGITMDQLHASSDIVDRDGNLANGINAYTLINEVVGMANEYHSDCAITDMFVADNKNKAQGNGIAINKRIKDAYQQKTGTDNIPFAAATFNRVFCNIELSRQHTDTHVANIVVATKQQGLQVAVGAHCHACRNQTILGANHLVSSYGGRKAMDTQEFLRCVDLMLQGYRFVDDMEALRKMQQYELKDEHVLMLMGYLRYLYAKYNSRDASIRAQVTGNYAIYPMDACQLNRLDQCIVQTERAKHGQPMTVYDIYQGATTIYKVARTDMPNILPQNLSFVKTLSEVFGLAL
jgi:hypothetical protein